MKAGLDLQGFGLGQVEVVYIHRFSVGGVVSDLDIMHTKRDRSSPIIIAKGKSKGEPHRPG